MMYLVVLNYGLSVPPINKGRTKSNQYSSLFGKKGGMECLLIICCLLKGFLVVKSFKVELDVSNVSIIDEEMEKEMFHGFLLNRLLKKRRGKLLVMIGGFQGKKWYMPQL